MLPSRRFCSVLVVAALTACGKSDSNGVPAPGGPPVDETPAGGSSVLLTMPPARSAEIDSLRQSLEQLSPMTADAFADKFAVNYGPALDYDPKVSAGLDRIMASALGLSRAELDGLGAHGFVISAGHAFPTFTYGYATLYGEHLPLYVSADSILSAVHRSYDKILKQMEQGVLGPELVTLLQSLRSSLARAGSLDAAVRRDVDFYLAVALGLLTGSAAPVAGAKPADISSFLSKANAASGTDNVTIFGVERAIDFSQFTPRGHYADSDDLGRYFRAMMWLGRIDFRLIETQNDGSQLFYRRQFNAMLGLSSLFDGASIARHEAIDEVIQAFVGESDNMKVGDVGRLLADLGAEANASAVALPDERIAQAILDGGYGAERVASDLMVNDVPSGDTLPLHRTFLVFGQRYTLDSHVFSNVTYDRVAAARMMPSPLDAAFAALGSNQAGLMLDSELRKYGYAPNLASMRILADAHGDSFWGENLYNIWLSSLRALSPGGTLDPAAAGMPVVTGTEAWQRRLLNTQLASWAELRHDTILYVKQSYTTGVSCEFPDAYVEPYPEFFTALERFADFATAHVVPVARRSTDAQFATAIGDYFGRLGHIAGLLRQMAESERAGTPFTSEQMAFINQAVTIQPICGGPGFADGWYPSLVFGDATSFEPTIADVHTQPTDEAGNPVGRVLHVGTGYARLMVVTANTCTGPRAYAGLSSSYYEKVTENYDRLTDQRWANEFGQTTPEDVAWMTDLVAR